MIGRLVPELAKGIVFSIKELRVMQLMLSQKITAASKKLTLSNLYDNQRAAQLRLQQDQRQIFPRQSLPRNTAGKLLR